MDEDKYILAGEIQNHIIQIEYELNQLKPKIAEDFQSSVCAKKNISDPLGVGVILRYPSKEAAQVYRLACLNALENRLKELQTEFNRL